MPCARRVLNNNLRKLPIGVFKESVRSWSHASLLTKVKTFTKKLLAVRPKTLRRGRKRKKDGKKKDNCKAFCVIRKRNKVNIKNNSHKYIYYFDKGLSLCSENSCSAKKAP